MIKDKDVQIAESEEEAYWYEVIENSKKEIKALERALKFNKAVLEMAQTKIDL